MKKQLTKEQRESLLTLLKTRFTKNMHRHKDLDWKKVAGETRSKSSKNYGRLMKWKPQAVNLML
jgi:hypothetical protein